MSLLRAISTAAVAVTTSLALARVHPFGDAGLYSLSVGQPQFTPALANVREILTAKCANCHSAQTKAPIYGRFAPISWLLERDIVEARKAMNLSEWDAYSQDQQDTLKSKIVQEAKAHDMPPLQYLLIHWSARINTSDQQVLAQWAQDSTPAVDSSAPTNPGDPVRGQIVFEKRCTGCHALTQSHEGPRLQGVYGRPAASIPGFPYSDALKNAHFVWNDTTLEKWLTEPDDFLPGVNMDFRVIKPQERKDVIAYFKQSAGT